MSLTTEKLQTLKGRVKLGTLAKSAGLDDRLLYSATRPDVGTRKPRDLSAIEAALLTAQLKELVADIKKAIK